MTGLTRNILLLFGLISLFVMNSTGYTEPGDEEFEKVVATYDSWTVVINFRDVSNPRCLVRGTAATADAEYSSPVAFWKEKYRGELTPFVEVNLLKNGSFGNPVPLKKDPKSQTLMIRKMTVKGTRQDFATYAVVFNIGNGMVEKMAETNVAIATLVDSDGNHHELVMLLKGFKEAWSHCDRPS